MIRYRFFALPRGTGEILDEPI